MDESNEEVVVVGPDHLKLRLQRRTYKRKGGMAAKKGQRSLKAVEPPARYVSNFMAEMDGRTISARELRDNFKELVNDLGGLSELSYQERSLCERLIHLEWRIKKTEEVQANDGVVDPYVLLYQIRVLRELFNALGLKRRSKVLALKDYLEAKDQA